MRSFFGLITLLLLAGCANPYKKFYSPLPPPSSSLEPSSGAPQLVYGRDVQEDRIRFIEDGYIAIGTSSFNARRANPKSALAHGEQVGAAMVVLYSRYRNTETGAMPITVPSTQTSYTNISGTTGSRSFYGSGTTTTYGTSTTYVPYSVDRWDYFAVYFKRAMPATFGVFVRDPKPDERRGIGKNSGVVIEAVRKGSPAFRADLFRGDVLMRIGNRDIGEVADFFDAVRSHQGQTTTVQVIRDGKLVERPITMGVAP